MPNPTITSVHVDQPLTDVSVAYFQANMGKYAARRIFPAVGVSEASNKYRVYNRGDLLRTDADYRAPGAEAETGGYRITYSTYNCDRVSFAKDVDDPTRANADAGIDLDAEAAMYVTDQIMRREDKAFLADFFATGKWDGASSSTDMTGQAAPASTSSNFLQWNDAASTPIEDIRGEMNAVEGGSGYRPNKLVLGPETKRFLQDHPDVLDRIKYTQRGIVTDDLLAALFEVDQVVTLRAVENTGAENAAESNAFMAGKHALLLYAPSSPGLYTPTAGYSFVWTGNGSPLNGVRMKSYRLERNESDRVEGECWFDHVQVASDLAAFFASAVA